MKIIRRCCKECGCVVCDDLPPYRKLPYYCQVCGEDKEEYETELVEDDYL